MRARLLALALLLAALLVQLGVAAPARASLERAEDQQRRLRDERRELMRRLAPAERRERERQRALKAFAAQPLPEGHEAQAVRRVLLETLAKSPLRGVRVEVRPGRAGAVIANLACEGALEAVLKTSAELARSGSGLIVSRARLSATASGVALELEATSLGRTP